MTAIPDFKPRIFEQGGVSFYEDGRVFGAVDINGECFVISEWSSHFHGHGHTTEALEWIRGQGYAVIAANGVGMIEDGEGDISTYYWEHMREKGLVDVLIDDEGVEIQPGWSAQQDSGSPFGLRM